MESNATDVAEDVNLNMIKAESKISRTLSEKTTKTVIILTLVMLFSNPIFTSDSYVTFDTSYKLGMETIGEIYLKFGNGISYEKAIASFIDFHKDKDSYYLIELNAPVGVTFPGQWKQGDISSYRTIEREEVEVDFSGYKATSYFSRTDENIV